MELNQKIINTEPKFEKDELMRLFLCLLVLQKGGRDDNFESNFQLYQGATFYLGSKIGAELEEEEKQLVERFATKVLKITKENQGV